jgi:DNA primase
MVTLPAGEDPDSLVRGRGASEFKQLLEEARPTIEVLSDLGLKNGSDVEARTAALKKLIPMLVACKDRLRLGNYIRLIADRFDLDEDYLRQAVRQAEQRQRPSATLSGSPADSGATSRGQGAGAIPLHIEEETCLVLLMKFPHLAERISDSGVLERFDSEAARELARKFLAAGPHHSPAPLLDSVDDRQLRERLSGKLIDDTETPEDKADSSLEDCIRKVRLRHIKRELRSLSGRISQAEKDGRDEERKQLTLNKMRLDQERRSLEGL